MPSHRAGGDQGLLNDFFSSWATDFALHLPFTYNMTINARPAPPALAPSVTSRSYGYAPAYLRHKAAVKIVHFAGNIKPWRSPAHAHTGPQCCRITRLHFNIFAVRLTPC